ncbi:MAG: 5'-deoxynucleotidase [Oscillospiraceae bacterium]|nr:5'-deoxynucleotidase [Oscillospiraceae bacterium]
MGSSFFAFISRMKHIRRWGLMRNSCFENVQEHSHMAAVTAHALAVIRRDVYGIPCDPNEAAVLALYHDAPEILTGDLPTPVKYHDRHIISAYRQVEKTASEKLTDMLPAEIREAYRPLLFQNANEETLAVVRAADKLSAYIKCIEERKAGNSEFISAEKQTLEKLKAMKMPEVEYFLDKFIPAFELTLDELEPGTAHLQTAKGRNKPR